MHDAWNYFFILRPTDRLFQTYMDILERVSSPWRKLQTSQGLCKRLTRPGSRIKASLWERKTNQQPLTCTSWGWNLTCSTAPANSTLWAALAAKSLVWKNRKHGRWYIIYTCSRNERDEGNRRGSGMTRSHVNMKHGRVAKTRQL